MAVQRCFGARTAAFLVALAIVGCAGPSGDTTILQAGKVSSIVIGQSSRADVLALLGKPSRTEWNNAGEQWVYQAREGDGGRQGLSDGAAVAGGVLGALVPFGGLLGTGLGLAGSQAADAGPGPATTTFTVAFGATGAVRDCTYATTAVPKPAAAGAAAAQPVPQCQAPARDRSGERRPSTR